jgi:AAA+ superfamily predicted ATPase
VRSYLIASGRPVGPDAKDPRALASAFSVSTDEVSRLLEQPTQEPRRTSEVDLLRHRIDARVAASRQNGMRLPLAQLVDTFGLDELSRQLLTLALLGEIDDGIRRLYSYAWNDLTRKTPSIEFLLGLLQPSMFGKLLNVEAFFGSSPLTAGGLLRPSERTDEGPFLAREVQIAPSVTAFCLGGEELDPDLALCARVRSADFSLEPLVLASNVMNRILRSFSTLGRAGAAVIVLVGSAGVGKSAIVRRSIPRYIEVDVASLMRPSSDAEDRIFALQRDARLLRLPLVIDLAEADDDPQLTPYHRLLARTIDAHPHGAIIMARDQVSWFVSLLSQAVVHDLGLPVKAEREHIWRRALIQVGLSATPAALEAASRFPLTGGSIERAAQTAVAQVQVEGGPRGSHPQEILEACRAQLTPRLSGVAQRIVTTFVWDDLVLPEKEAGNLREIVAYAKNRHRVFDDWGFDRLVPYGRGLSVLFSGPPGTGKTMAAGIVGGELGMDVFRVDLSRMVSKYIGETEKNLSKVFDEAGKSQSILLFDEADSLFAKRTGVNSAVDRYANLEVNYLLQRVEDFDGVTILTTNFEGSIDEAFRRRIKFRVVFPAPDQEMRSNLWAKMIPAEAQREGVLDFEALAHDYELSGGHIKNSTLRAAFSAAERRGGISMKDLRRAARLESEKLGKIVRVPDDIDTSGN